MDFAPPKPRWTQIFLNFSGLPPETWRTRATLGCCPGLSSFALAMASFWVGATALALSELALRTA